MAAQYRQPRCRSGALTEAVNNRLEAWIRAKPESWLWLHRHWRRTSTPGRSTAEALMRRNCRHSGAELSPSPPSITPSLASLLLAVALGVQGAAVVESSRFRG